MPSTRAPTTGTSVPKDNEKVKKQTTTKGDEDLLQHDDPPGIVTFSPHRPRQDPPPDIILVYPSKHQEEEEEYLQSLNKKTTIFSGDGTQLINSYLSALAVTTASSKHSQNDEERKASTTKSAYLDTLKTKDDCHQHAAHTGTPSLPWWFSTQFNIGNTRGSTTGTGTGTSPMDHIQKLGEQYIQGLLEVWPAKTTKNKDA
jgi:hypothetical protein